MHIHPFYTFVYIIAVNWCSIGLPQQLLRVEWGTVYFVRFLCPSCSCSFLRWFLIPSRRLFFFIAEKQNNHWTPYVVLSDFKLRSAHHWDYCNVCAGVAGENKIIKNQFLTKYRMIISNVNTNPPTRSSSPWSRRNFGIFWGTMVTVDMKTSRTRSCIYMVRISYGTVRMVNPPKHFPKHN